MNRQKYNLLLLVLLPFLITNCSLVKQQHNGDYIHTKSKLYHLLKTYEQLDIKIMEPDSGFVEKYELMIKQPLDHKNPKNGSFKQRIFLSHKGFKAPTVLHTEGYSAGHNFCAELPLLLEGNEVRVEHRFFGKSLPDSMNWQFLNIEQAAADYHAIVELFKKIYSGKWINTGWSKGGQTSIFHRYFYPGDVNASVIYDSPLNFELEDRRIDAFFDTVGTPEIRSRLVDFQRLALLRKDELLPLFRWYATGKGDAYSIGHEKALEYIILEYPFSFWQYHHLPIDSIPTGNATNDEILTHLKKIVSFSSYSDRSMNSPSMFQFSTELGYYGYVTKNVKALLSDHHYPNYAYAPRVPELEYDPKPMRQVNQWLQQEGNNFIYIYGENDPWSAPAINISPNVNSKKYYLKSGNHYTFIKTFPKDKQEEIMGILKEWIK